MRPARVAVALALLAAAAVLALLGEDVRRWPGRIEAGDQRLSSGSAAPGLWEPDDALPLRVAPGAWASRTTSATGRPCGSSG